MRHRIPIDAPRAKPAGIERRMLIRFENNRHIVTFHNTAYGCLSVRPGLCAAGRSKVRFRNFRHRALG